MRWHLGILFPLFMKRANQKTCTMCTGITVRPASAGFYACHRFSALPERRPWGRESNTDKAVVTSGRCSLMTFPFTQEIQTSWTSILTSLCTPFSMWNTFLPTALKFAIILEFPLHLTGCMVHVVLVFCWGIKISGQKQFLVCLSLKTIFYW